MNFYRKKTVFLSTRISAERWQEAYYMINCKTFRYNKQGIEYCSIFAIEYRKI